MAREILDRTPAARAALFEYILRAPLGTLCAFWSYGRTGDRWLCSGRLVARDDRCGALVAAVEMLGGEVWTVPAADFVWIKTGVHWPRHVLEVFSAQKRILAKRAAEAACGKDKKKWDC